MTKNSYLWALITAVLLLSLQILGLVIYIFSFIPYPAFWSDPFLKGVDPNRDPLFFAIFVITAGILMILGVIGVLPKFDQPDFRRKFKLWLGLESLWCFLMVFVFFKWTTYKYAFWNILPYENPTWLQPFFNVTCAMAILSKIFFPEIESFYKRWKPVLDVERFPRWYAIAGQVIFVGGVVVLLYIPRPQDVSALALVWDQWNHLDRFTAWFIKHGLYISYEGAIQILITMAIGYIIGLFYFIRLWLGSWLLAAIGALLAIKMGLFYYGAAPCVWINPANTFLIHGWDIIFLFGFWYIATKHPQVFDDIAALTGVLLVCCWFRSNGYMDGLGLDDQPMMAPLRVRQFFPFLMGYFVPLFYVFSLLILMGQRNTTNAKELRLPVSICIYGLMIFVDYLEHPMIGFYGSLMVPAILIMLWWVRKFKRWANIWILALVIGALMTNRLMMTYPNSIFQDKGRFLQERAYLEHFDAITPSAALIQQLTKEDQKVALLSSFETALLMKAQRQPLFNDFPVMSSSLNAAGGLNLKTKAQCLGLMDSLVDEHFSFVFVDQRLLELSLQALGNSGLSAVLSFLNNHYKEYARQGFLVALQRR